MISKQLVKKAVIPAAGLGTRFLPATKAVPKELLPIVDVPTIQIIAEEIARAGIETVILITGRGKSAIEDHFDVHLDLENKLLREGKTELAQRLQETSNIVQIVSVRQQSPRGLGDAVLCARDIIGDEPFVVLLGDDLVDSSVPCTKQMIDVYNKHQKSVVALMEVPPDEISKFGICGGKTISEREIELDIMVEKPAEQDAPSNLAIVGRYILTPRIFELLEQTQPGKAGEIQLTDAMSRLMKEQGFIGYKFQGNRYDAGDRFGYLQANIAYALKRPDIAPKLIDYMRRIVSERS
ncbi:MAG: UTP--glucose-1-phosphate uridylyltransferase GalU [Oligoflexia bacterium]|nr:UTP--glucose-1-phosphate uridylyltransferase GalU [Oligoflexia bacterium]